MPAQFEVEPSTAALERRSAISTVIAPGTTGNDFAVESGKPGNLVIITGGNKMRPYMGIGPAVGIELARRGMDNIVITSTSKPESIDQAYEAAQLMANEGARVVWMGVDHTNREDNIELVNATFERFRRVNYFVGNAGDMKLRMTFRADYAAIERDIALMLTANYQICKAIFEEARRTKTLDEFKAGVFSGSAVSRLSDGGQAGYAMAKAGLVGLANDLGSEFGKYTRFNVAEFGFVRTQMTQKLHEDERGQDFAKQRIALGRIAEPEEAAKAVAFLLSPDASYITRSVLTVDGGIRALAK